LRHTAVYVGEQEKEEDVYTGEFDVLTSPTKEKKKRKKNAKYQKNKRTEKIFKPKKPHKNSFTFD